MKILKLDFGQLKCLRCILIGTLLLSFCPASLIAVELDGIEALLELEPLDNISISPQDVIDKCTKALDKQSGMKENQICQLYFKRGVALGFLGKYEMAIRDLTEVLNRRPKDCRSLRFRGQFHDNLHQRDEARADYESIVKLQPNCGIGYAYLALSYMQTGDLISSKKFADKTIALDPEEPQGYLVRSRVHMEEYQLKESFKDINKCISLSYGAGSIASAKPFLIRASLHMFYDDTKRALPDLLMAQGLNNSDRTTKGIFCQYYFKTGKYHMAFYLSEQLLKVQTNRPDLKGMRVHCLIERNRQKEALRLADSMIEDSPRWWGGYLSRGEVYFKGKKYKEALQDYDKSLASNPDSIHTMAAKAYLLAACPEDKIRDGQVARTLARKCCEATDYRTPRHLMLLAMASAECGDYEEAIRWAKKSLEKADSSFPSFGDYKQRLALFEKERPYRLSSDSRVFDYLFP